MYCIKKEKGVNECALLYGIGIGVVKTQVAMQYIVLLGFYRWVHFGSAAYQLGNTSSRTITEVRQR